MVAPFNLSRFRSSLFSARRPTVDWISRKRLEISRSILRYVQFRKVDRLMTVDVTEADPSSGRNLFWSERTAPSRFLHQY